MKIRKAVINDAENIINVVQSSYKFSYKGYVPDDYLDSLSITEDILEKWKNYLQKYDCYVVEIEQKIIAFMMLDILSLNEIFEICILYVKPEYQKNGAGSLLVNYACEMKKNNNYKTCEIWTIKNGPAIEFYKKMNFIITEQEKPWKFDIPIVKMIKNLN